MPSWATCCGRRAKTAGEPQGRQDALRCVLEGLPRVAVSLSAKLYHHGHGLADRHTIALT